MTAESLAPSRSQAALIAATVLAGFRSHGFLYGFAGLVLLAALAEAAILKLPFDFEMVMIFSGPVLLILMVLMMAGLLLEVVRLARAGHQGSVTLALGRKVRDDYFAPLRVANALHSFLFMSAYMVGYTFIKKAIPTAHPFAWDPDLAALDKAFHFGHQPYELLSFLNVPVITFLLNMNYNIWFFVMFTLWFWQGFAARDTRLRLHFLLGFTLTWFLGTCILGTVFSSVGPCFYGRLYPGDETYAPVLAWLSTANKTWPIFSLNVMDELWKNYETGVGMVNGISAMPSMHVGTSVLFAVLGFASGKRWLGWLLSGFAACIFLGSIHLGWHYAIDGYAGAAIALFGWWLAGQIVDWARPELRHS
ncbi:MAG: phosphatase PAP2 family protein [Hyphomicrobiales bacterium]